MRGSVFCSTRPCRTHASLIALDLLSVRLGRTWVRPYFVLPRLYGPRLGSCCQVRPGRGLVPSVTRYDRPDGRQPNMAWSSGGSPSTPSPSTVVVVPSSLTNARSPWRSPCPSPAWGARGSRWPRYRWPCRRSRPVRSRGRRRKLDVPVALPDEAIVQCRPTWLLGPSISAFWRPGTGPSSGQRFDDGHGAPAEHHRVDVGVGHSRGEVCALEVGRAGRPCRQRPTCMWFPTC